MRFASKGLNGCIAAKRRDVPQQPYAPQQPVAPFDHPQAPSINLSAEPPGRRSRGSAGDKDAASHRSRILRATRTTSLDRRTRYRSIGTEHAAVSRFRLEPLATTLAIIEELARVRRHPLGRRMAAFWTGNCRLLNHARSPRLSIRSGSGYTNQSWQFCQRLNLPVWSARQPLRALTVTVAPNDLHPEGGSRVSIPCV